MPFTGEQFFEVFGRYNEAAWPAQLALYGAAAAALALAWSDRRHSKYVAAILAFLWAWAALAYHAAFFGTIDPLGIPFAALFLAQAALFVWYGVIDQRLVFSPRPGLWRAAGSALVVYALVGYPIVAVSFGQHYPEMPTFGLPCPTAIFTLGMLMWARPSLPASMWIVPLLWAAVGTVGAAALRIPEDFGLPVAALLAAMSIHAHRHFEHLHAHAVLERFIEAPDVESVHETVIAAPAVLVMDEACNFDLQSVALVRGLFSLRARMLGSAAATASREGLVAQMKAFGWTKLAEQPGRELVLGAAAQPWRADVRFTPIPPVRFAAYAEPGCVKIAWTLEAEPLGDARCRFRTQTRAVATDAVARRKFRLYWALFGGGAMVIRWLVLRALRRQAERRFREIAVHALHTHAGPLA